jgi:long-chain acyl-CoA synthetase
MGEIRPWVQFADEAVALEHLEARGARAACALGGCGIGAGDVVAILLRNEPAFIEALTCIRCLESQRVLIPWHLTAREIREIVAAVRPAALIVHRDLLPRVTDSGGGPPGTRIAVVETHPELRRVYELPAEEPLPPYPELQCWDTLIAGATGALSVPTRTIQAISITSGSTGRPKIIRWEGAQHWVQWAEARTERRPPITTSLVTAPLYHGGQYGAFSHAYHRRANLILMPKFDAERFLQAVERHRVNHAYLVPTMFVRLLKLPRRVRERYDLSSLDYVLHTGAPCAQAIKRQMIDWWGPVIWEAYGCSEVSVISACSSEDWLKKPGTVGRPVRSVVILDDQGRACAAGQTGQICVSTTGMPRLSYQNQPTKRYRIHDGEFIPTGDLGHLDVDGDLFVRGRADDLINTGRVKVHPVEIENVMLRDPRVLDCIVHPVPDAEFGQVIAAVVQVSDAAAHIETELRAFLAGQISEHKIPVRMRIQTDSLRTETGKLKRQTLASSPIAVI